MAAAQFYSSAGLLTRQNNCCMATLVFDIEPSAPQPGRNLIAFYSLIVFIIRRSFRAFSFRGE
jgi:hypothetical protein